VPTPSFSRRTFLAGGAIGAAALAAGTLGIDQRPSPPTTAGSAVGEFGVGGSGVGSSEVPVVSAGRRILVLVTMYGGNDGLNTVIPASDPVYRAGRPTLGYQPGQTLDLGDGLGLNPKLTNLAALWKQKQLAVVRGVGYPNPNLSHFDSMGIWQTANPQSGTGPGWLGTWLDGTHGDPLEAVSMGPTLPAALTGRHSAAAALTSSGIHLPGSVSEQRNYASLVEPGPDRIGLAALVASSGSDLLTAKAELARLQIAPASGTATASATLGTSATSVTGGAAGGTLSDQLAVVAQLIRADAPTVIYQVSLSSFDTHSDEKAAQEAKLAELDAGIGSFFTQLRGAPNAAGTVLMTYSEFGRRVAQNASGGTDHGTAAPLFVVGPSVKGGTFYGDQPSLTKLDENGNLLHNVDFRSVYATVLEDVVGVNAATLLGGRFPILDLL
jgi:uncharacterized protein (DUF1501 family)